MERADTSLTYSLFLQRYGRRGRGAPGVGQGVSRTVPGEVSRGFRGCGAGPDGGGGSVGAGSGAPGGGGVGWDRAPMRSPMRDPGAVLPPPHRHRFAFSRPVILRGVTDNSVSAGKGTAREGRGGAGRTERGTPEPRERRRLYPDPAVPPAFLRTPPFPPQGFPCPLHPGEAAGGLRGPPGAAQHSQHLLLP